jgi:hypothetical protein
MLSRNALSSILISFLVAESLSTSRQSLAAEASDQKQACLTAADSGQSLRDDGRYSSARDQFLACARDACPKIVHDQCTEWLRQLDDAMPTVVFAAKDEHGNDVSGARVFSGSKLVTSNLDGKPVALDPGPYDIRFERDPNQSVTLHVVLRSGEKNRAVTATFPGEGQLGTPPEGTEPAPAPPGAEPEQSSSFWNGRNVTSLTLLAGGVVAGGLGLFFGLQSQSENDQAQTIFKNDLHENRAACFGSSLVSNATICHDLSDKRDAQNRDAVLNEVFYIAGGTLAVGAVATWLLWPKRQDERAGTAWIAPTIGPGRAGVGIRGSF